MPFVGRFRLLLKVLIDTIDNQLDLPKLQSIQLGNGALEGNRDDESCILRMRSMIKTMARIPF